MNPNHTNFLKAKDAAKIIGMAAGTLRDYRSRGLLKEDIHYVTWGPSVVRYVEDNFRHWAEHRNAPEIHQAWLDAKALESSSPSKRKRNA